MRRRQLVLAGQVNLAMLLARIRPVEKYSEVIQIYRQAAETGKALVAADDPTHQDELGSVYSNMAVAYRQMMQLDEDNLHRAKEACDTAIRWQESLTKQHPDVVDYHHKLATSYGNLSVVLLFEGDAARGVTAVRRALQVRCRTIPSLHAQEVNDDHCQGFFSYSRL